MKETRTINLNGMVYMIDLDAYQMLQAYLHDIESRLAKDEKQDVMTDIEARVAELISRALFAKNVQSATIEMIESIKRQIGAPSEFGEYKRPVPHRDKSQNSGCGRAFIIALKVIGIIIGIQILMPVIAVVGALLLGIFGVSTGLIAAAPVVGVSMFGGSTGMVVLTMLTGMGIILIPIIMVIYSIICYMRSHHGPKARFWYTTIVLWLACLILLLIPCHQIIKSVFNDQGLQQGIQAIINYEDSDDGQTLFTYDSLATYSAINVTGKCHVTLEQSNEPIALMSAVSQENASMEVRDGVLYIQSDDQYDDAHITLRVPSLRCISLAGAAELKNNGQWIQDSLTVVAVGASSVELEGVQIKYMKGNLVGASEMELNGQIDEAEMSLMGASEMEAEGSIGQAHINCAGASTVKLDQVERLWAQAAGASHISYHGQPVLEKSMAVGASSIKRR